MDSEITNQEQEMKKDSANVNEQIIDNLGTAETSTAEKENKKEETVANLEETEKANQVSTNETAKAQKKESEKQKVVVLTGEAKEIKAVTDSETDDKKTKAQAEAEVNNSDNEKENAPESKESPKKKSFDQEFSNRQNVLAYMEGAWESKVVLNRSETEKLKQIFFKLSQKELEEKKKAYIDAGNDIEKFLPIPDAIEERMKELRDLFKKRREEHSQEINKIKEENLTKKLGFITRLKEIVASENDINKFYHEVKEIQRTWNDLKLVPEQKVSSLWKEYHIQVEKFYDRLRINHEYRDYDFKKNKEIKEKLCKIAEDLLSEPDIISAFHQLQNLHQEYREAGPVDKEIREPLWQRFKAASTEINKKHQEHFEQLREKETDNFDKKTVICEIVEQVDFTGLKNFSDWDRATKEVLALQAKWKTIGYAPQKMNNKVFDRFRKACDIFFETKAKFFKEIKKTMNENLAKKRALCEQAEAIKDSTDWEETAEKLIQLQKDWKTIGPVPRKHSDSLWKRFLDACDCFFAKKKIAKPSKLDLERKNLKIKKGLIAELRALTDEVPLNELRDEINSKLDEWKSLGHVPYRDKDKIFKQFHDEIDRLMDITGGSSRGGKRNSSSNNFYDKKAGSNSEKSKLMHDAEKKRNEINTFENNLGFFKSAQSSNNPIVEEMLKNVEKLKSELSSILIKIKEIDHSKTDSNKEKDTSIVE